MKKQYSKPFLEVEVYQLNAALAAGCSTPITFGPGGGGHEVCKEYKDSWGEDLDPWSLRPQNTERSFYDYIICTCYYTSSDTTLLTS